MKTTAKKASLTLSMFAFFAAASLATDATLEFGSDATLKDSYYATSADIDGNASLVVNGSTVCSQWSSNSDLWILVGGGADGVSVGGNTSLTLNGATVNDSGNHSEYTGILYGGGADNSSVGGNATLSISGGTVVSGLNQMRGAIFGGSGASSTIEGDSTVTISGSGTKITGTAIFGGSSGAIFTRSGGTISRTISDKTQSVVKGNTTVNILDGATIDYASNAGEVVAAGYGNNVVYGNAYVNVEDSTANCVIYNGGNTAYDFENNIGTIVYGSSEIYIKNSTFKNVWGNGLIGYGNANFDGNGNFVSLVDSSKIVAKLTIEKSSSSASMGVIGNNNAFSSDSEIKTIAIAYGSVEINVVDSTLTNSLTTVGIGGVVYGNAITNVENSKMDKIYGGACRGATVYGDSIINIVNSVIGSDIYNGGMAKASQPEALHCGNSIITIEDSELHGILYAGGRGANTLIKGDATVTLIGDVHNEEGKSLQIVGVGATDGDSATVHGAVLGTKTLNLGTSEKAFAGTSVLDVSYFDTINVNAGSTANFGDSLVIGGNAGECAAQTMNVAAKAIVTAGTISIASAGTLSLTVGKAGQLAGTVENAGTLIIKASSDLEVGTYQIATGGISGAGTISVFGGTYADGNLTVAGTQKIDIDTTGTAIQLTDNGRAILSKDGEEKIELAFNASNVTISSVTTATVEFTSALSQNFVTAEAYDFGVTGLQNGESVLISFVVNNAALTLSDFKIYHKNDGADSIWEIADDITNLSYDGQTLSFVATHFSGYGYAATPEPAMFGLLAGTLALALAGTRRRRRER